MARAESAICPVGSVVGLAIFSRGRVLLFGEYGVASADRRSPAQRPDNRGTSSTTISVVHSFGG